MAINIFLNGIEKDDIKDILKTVIYLIYRKTPLTQEMISFILEFGRYYHFNDTEFEELFIVDTRYNFDIQDTVSSLSKEGNKMLLFSLVLFAEIFDEIDLDDIYDELKIYTKLPIGKSMQKSIIKATKDYVKKTIIMHYFIYDKKLPFYVEFANIQNWVDISDEKYKHFFIVDRQKIDSLSKKEKIAFLKALQILMNDDGKITQLERSVVDIWKYYMGIFDIDNINITNKPQIKHLWLKNMLLFSYLITQNNHKKSLQNAQKILGISHDNATKLVKNVQTYYQTVKNLYDLIYHKKLTHLNENKAKNMDRVLNTAEFILMILPQTKPLKMIKGLNVVRQAIGKPLQEQNRCKIGIKALQKGSSNRLIIVIDGFLSESKEKEFDDWMQSLPKLYPDDNIQGFSWKAQNYNTIISGGISSWYKAVSQTLAGADRLSKYIIEQLDKNPNIKITLMGHSLGARVIFNTLYKLSENCKTIDSVVLLAGAVNSDIVNWTDVSDAVKRIYNFYSKNDNILKTLYQVAMMDTPIGLNRIEIIKTDERYKTDIYNYNVTHLVQGHNDYKPKLYKILTQSNIQI